jgi:intracellular sulfur oxidation DsrE/DsrF family protein
MKRLAFPLLAAAALAGCASMHDGTSAAGSKEVRMAFDITDTATTPLIVKLETIELTRKQLVDAGYTPRMVLSFRGNASYYTQTDLTLVKEADRADTLRIQSLIKQLKQANGIEAVEQCNVPLESRKIKTQNLMQEVKLVPNGWISLAEHQKKGYAYIAP